MAQEISKNHDNWEKRRSALVSMQQAIEEVTSSGQGGPSVFTANMWRYLKEPLKHTLNDLRSALVKEACMLLEKLSTAAGDSIAPFVRDVLNVLLQLLTNGNPVISAQVNSCMRHVIKHTRFPRQLKEMEYMVRNSRSKDLREMVASYVRLILDTWPAASMEREIASLESLVSMQLADASSAARTDARASFGLFQQHWPKRAGKILKGADPRTAKALREEYGLDEDEDAASTTGRRTATKAKDAASTAGRRIPTKAKAPARSSNRAPKPKPTGAGAGTAGGRIFETSQPFLKKGSSSSEGPTSPPTPGSSSQTRRKQRFLMRTPPGSYVSRAIPKTAGHSPLFVGSGAKARPPLIASTDGFLAGGARVRNVATSLSRGGGGKATSPDGTSGSGLNVASERGLTPLVPGDKVRLKGSPPRSAIVRYVGETQFATGIWVGVELSRSVEPPGKNNGSVNGVPYFRCPPTRGIFLRASMVEPEEVTDDGDSEPFAAEWWGAKGVRGQTGRAYGVEATEGEKEAMSVGADLLRCHKLFTNEAMEALEDAVGTLRDLEGAVESGEVICSDRLRYFLEILESAAEAREAAASRLRAQIRQALRRHPGILDTLKASDFLSQSLYSDHGSLFGPDCAGGKHDEEEAGVVEDKDAKTDVSGGTGGQEDAIDGGGSDSAGSKPPGPGQAEGRRRPLHAPARESISPTSPPAPGSSSQTRRKQRFLLRTPPGSSVSRARPKTAGHSPLFVGSGAKPRPPFIASSSAPLLVSTDGFLAGGASIRNVAASLSRGGGGKATSSDGTSGRGLNVASEMGLTPLVPGDKVRLKGSPPRRAIIRYVGETQFATGIWVVVELSRSVEPPGNNNGSVNGVPYFRCPPTRGIFLRANMVEREEEPGEAGVVEG